MFLLFRQHSDKAPPAQHRPSTLAELLLGLAGVLALGGGLGFGLGASPATLGLAVAGYALLATLVARFHRHSWGLGWANRITLARGVLVAVLAGCLADPASIARHAWLFAATSGIALLLDGVDGWVARRTGTASAFGARFDMELDAAFILVLCLALLTTGKLGAWVLAIGVMRYAFVLLGRRWPWMAAELPESRRRKAVCVWQVAVLLLALLPPIPSTLAGFLAAGALLGLTASFAMDIVWLHRNAR
ncbi:CDP-alcohol phosphatidyltransferase family protein [Billgrantia gudaonensis]|uniref:Phosphatidylglycerophosphate synthase n=1 Tax=Billgrantia gudaonensis TaxID=376427 RepID=A0A1G8ZJN0_9GAMM|nr:CDP-alcohol phosphatidyltransferase family protein [Halomonas gudaonensis]SDK15267.1 Phosphatidylglycerophosphate synthase [Halomonas gudaonensis]